MEHDLIQEFEISLYFSTVLLKYLAVIGLFTGHCEMVDLYCSQIIWRHV